MLSFASLADMPPDFFSSWSVFSVAVEGGEGGVGFQAIFPGLGRTGGGLAAEVDEAGFSKAAIRSRREPGLGFAAGGCGGSDMENDETENTQVPRPITR